MTKKSDVTLYLRNSNAQRVDFGICHKQNIGEEPGQVKFGVDPDEAPRNPKKWSKIWFLSSAKDNRVPRGLIFGYVVGLKLALNAYLVNIGIGPNLDPYDPQKGSKKIGPVCALYTLSLSLSCTSVITFLAPRCEFSVCYNFPNLNSKSF